MNEIICIDCNKEIEQDHFFKLIKYEESHSCTIIHIDCNIPEYKPVKKLLPKFIASRY